MNHVVIQWTDERRTVMPVAMHIIPAPNVMEAGGYVQAKTIEGFRRRRTGGRFQMYFERDLEGGVSKFEADTYGYDTLPKTTHETVWAFYDAIGYDHKVGKFR